MSVISSIASPLVDPVDNLTIPQFLLDDTFQHPTLLARKAGVPCLIEEITGQKIYFDELKSRTHYIAKAIKARWDIGRGDIVAAFSPNHIDYPTSIWAVLQLGGVIAATSPSLTADELVYQLQIAKPVLLVVHLDVLPTALKAAGTLGFPQSKIIVIDGHKSPNPLPYTSIEDLVREGRSAPDFTEMTFKQGEAKTTTAFLCFSSGTTGKPKAVCISHYNLICNVIQVATFNRIHEEYAPWDDRRFRPGDVCSGVLPLYHIYGLVVNLHFILYAGMTLVVTQKFNFEQMLDSISRYRITHLMIVPPQAVLFCKHPAVAKSDLSSVRYCLVAGAPVTAELSKQLLERFPDIHLGQAYGMTETCATVSMFPITQKVGTLGSGGQLVSGTTVKVVKTDGSLAKVGESGELYVQGGQVALGYYQNEAATNETFPDGWIRTGDEVAFLPNGDLFVVDRIKEIMKVKGFQVAPAELEGHLLDHPDIADAGVVGIADEYSGEVPLAFVVLQSKAAELAKTDARHAEDIKKSIFKHVSDAKSQYKWLAGGIVFLDILPKSPSGKILRRVLREQAKGITSKPRAKL
ncbi:phenylacetyl-CoA ligase [Infundibulicybe gibba]|nr:phenylacetyl-CoA ligase [Infundibulicybe gibba]